MQIKIFLIIILIFLCMPVMAQREYPESYYQNKWCSQWHGITEYTLQDKTRVDCLTKNYAVEFDFAQKWAEAVGQSLHYANMTGKLPAIILIIEKSEDFKYYYRLKRICTDHGIQLWYMKSPLYYDKMNLHHVQIAFLSLFDRGL